MTFAGLLDVAERILTAHYPADIFRRRPATPATRACSSITAVRAVLDARREDAGSIAPIRRPQETRDAARARVPSC